MKLAKHATTIALSALALGAGVSVLWLDRDRVTTTEAEARKKNLFEAYRPDDITELTLTSSGATARLVRGDLDDAGQHAWQVEIDGARYPADERAKDQLVSALEMGTAERCRSSRHTSVPGSPGSMRSSKTRSEPARSNSASAARPSAATVVS